MSLASCSAYILNAEKLPLLDVSLYIVYLSNDLFEMMEAEPEDMLHWLNASLAPPDRATPHLDQAKPSLRLRSDPPMPPPPPPPELMEEVIEEILLRLPPSDPASLVRAALVSTPWCRIVSGAAFRRRFRALHRTAPLLGFLCDPRVEMQGDRWDGVLVPTSSAFRPRAEPFAWWRPWDARHGRVLFHDSSSSYRPHVWNPITDARITLPEMPIKDPARDCWTSAVLCAAAGDCDHLDCHDGPFAVVIVGSDEDEEELFSYVYSSESGQWSEPTYADCPNDSISWDSSVLMGNALYFKFDMNNRILKYDLGTREMSTMALPRYKGKGTMILSVPCVQLITAEGGRRLGFARLEETRLCLWSMDDEADVGWAPSRAIELDKLLPFDASLASDTFLVGFAEGVDVIFMHVGDELFSVDLKSSKVVKVYDGPISCVVPYLSFRTPALRSASTAVRPRSDALNAPF